MNHQTKAAEIDKCTQQSNLRSLILTHSPILLQNLVRNIEQNFRTSNFLMEAYEAMNSRKTEKASGHLYLTQILLQCMRNYSK